MKIKLHAILLCILCSTSCASGNNDDMKTPVTPTPQLSTHFAGTWVTNVGSPVLYSKSGIEECVATCKKYHISDIFVCVWNKGRTLYPSKVMKNLIGIEMMEDFVGRDPLKEMVEAAHKEGIKVHAWFEYGFASANGKKGELLEKNPSWACKDQNGNILVKNNFYWMNPFMPEVQDFMLSLVTEVVKNYDIDGVQGDDRMPALPSEGGYDEFTVNLYKTEHSGSVPPVNTKDEVWLNWRCQKLTEFMQRLYFSVKAIKTNVVVSSAPNIYPWGKNEYLQDWPTWLKRGCIDYVVPQVYRYDINTYRSVVKQQLKAVNSELRKQVYIGLLIKNGSYVPSFSFLKQMIEANRSNSVLGECFWYYDGLKICDSYFQTYK